MDVPQCKDGLISKEERAVSDIYAHEETRTIRDEMSKISFFSHTSASIVVGSIDRFVSDFLIFPMYILVCQLVSRFAV